MNTEHRARRTFTQALEAWSRFPLDRDPRPLVLLSPRVAPTAFPDGATKRAFVNGAIEAAPGFPPEVFDVMRSRVSGPAGEPLLLIAATLGVSEFVTDRGRRELPAWQVSAQGVPEPIWVLDPAIGSQLWEPEDAGVSGRLGGWHGGSAVVHPDGRTVTAYFTGSPPEHADYPDARIIEAGGAVAILPIMVSRIPPDQPRFMIGARRDVTIVLSRPLGSRVVLDAVGIPVVVEDGPASGQS